MAQRTPGMPLAVRTVALGAMCLVAGLMVATPPVGAQGEDGLIVFESDRGGRIDIWVMEPDGSNQHPLTNDRVVDIFPEWSPDGSKIAWTRGGPGPGGELWVMNADGSGSTRITFNSFSDFDPTWAPDGETLAFRSRRAGNTDIFTINIDGTGERRLTRAPESDTRPDWSPTGARITFSRLGATCNIFTMRQDGSDVRKLTDDALDAVISHYSPSADRIMFTDNFCGFVESDVFVMRPDGSDVTQITDTSENELSNAWSPDGERSVVELSTFNKNQLGQSDLAILDMDTGEVTNVTRTRDVNEIHSDWSPAL